MTPRQAALQAQKIGVGGGEFRAGVVMTRFFWQVVLEQDAGVLEPLEEISVPEAP